MRGIARDAGIGGGMLAASVVAALTTVWVMGIQQARDRYQAEAARPKPTTTATVTAPVAMPGPARTTAVARPTATPTPAAVVPVADRAAAMPHNASGGLSHGQARPPSAPSPSPAAAPCSGQTLTVRLLHAACVTIGR